MASTNLGTLIVELLLKDSQFKSSLQNSTADMSSASDIMGNAANKMASMTATAMKAATASMAAFAGAAVVVGSQFEQQMAMVGALKGIDQTDQAFQKLEQQARFLGSTTEFTATQAGEALESLARAGASVNDAIKTSGDALTLAGTSATSLDNATQLLVSTQRQFSLSADDSTRITNVMSAAMRSSLLDFTSLREGMKFAGATGAGFKMSLEETTAALAKFRDLGMEGSLAGTQFRSAMALAGAATDKQRRILAKYGLTLEDINPETNSFAEILKNVGDVGITTTDSMQVFGRIAGGSMAQLARGAADGTLQIEELITTLKESSKEGNTAKDMYTAIANTVRFQTKIAISALQELFITFFDLFKGPLKDLVSEIPAALNTISQEFQQNSRQLKQQFESAFTSMREFLENNSQQMATAFVNITKLAIAFAAALTPLVTLIPIIANNIEAIGSLAIVAFSVKPLIAFVAIVNKLVIAFGFASSAVTVFGTTLTVTSGGLFAAVVAVGALVAALGTYISTTRKAKNETERLQQAQDRLEGQREEVDAAELERNTRALNYFKLLARRRLEEEELTNAERSRLESTLALSAAEHHRQRQTGQLLEVSNQLFTVQELINEMGFESVALIKEKAKAHEEEASELAAKRKILEKHLKQLEVQEKEEIRQFLINQHFKKQLRRDDLNNVEDYIAAIEDLQRRENESLERSANIRDEVSKAISNANRKQAASTVESVDTEVKTTTDGVNKLLRERQRYADKLESIRQEIAEEHAEATLDESGFEKFQNKQRLAELNAFFKEQRDLYEGDTTKQRQLDIEAGEIRLALIKAIAAKTTQARTDAEQKTQDELAELNEDALSHLNSLRQKDLSESQKLEQERNQVLKEFAEADVNTRLAIYEAYQAQIDALRKEENAASQKAFGWENVFDSIKEQLSNTFPRMTELIQGLGMSFQAFSEVVGAGIGAINGVMGALQQFTGFSFDPMAMAQDLADMKAEAEADGLDFNLEKQARKMVRTMVDDAILFVEALVESLPFLLDALVNNLPRLFTAIVKAIPGIIQSLVAAIPEIVSVLLQNLPAIAIALIKELAKIGPQLMFDLVKTFVLDFVLQIPFIIAEILKALIEGLVEKVKQIGEIFSNIFKRDPEKKAARKEKRAENKAARQAAFSGMDFVPATMKMTLHKGEAVIPADRNAQMQSGGPHTAGYSQAFGAQGQGQSGAPIEIAVVAEGRLLDAVQIKATERGHATGMKKAIRRASGAKVGFQRGRFNAWS